MKKQIKVQHKKTILIVLVVLVFVFSALFLFLRGDSSVRVTLYGTSTDLKTIQVERILFDLNERLGERMDLEIVMVSDIAENDMFASLNPDPDNPAQAQFDIAENQIQHVIKNTFPEQYNTYLEIRNERITDYNSDVYVKEAGVDFEQIKREIQDDAGQKYLREASVRYAELEEQYDIASIPAVFINNEYYEGNFDASTMGAAIVKPLLRGVGGRLYETDSIQFFNGAFSFDIPWSTKQVGGINECYQDLDCNDKDNLEGFCLNVGTPEAFCEYQDPARVDALLISDDACVSCFEEKAIASLRKDFKGLVVRQIDLDSEEASELIDDYQIDGLPVFLFEGNVENARNYEFYIENKLLERISEEDNRYVHTKTEARKLLDRPREENVLDLFISAYDAESIDIETQLIQFMRKKQERGEQFDLRIHHVLRIEVNEDGTSEQLPQTLSGPAETEESIRQAVIAQFFPDVFYDYLLKRNENLDRNYTEILEELGVSVQSFNNIVDQQGELSLLKSADLSAELSIQAVPYFLWENQDVILRVQDLKSIEQFSELE